MLKRVEFEAKSLQEAEAIAVEQLKIQKDKIKLTVLKEKKGFIGIGSSALYEATPNINLATEGKVFLEGIFQNLGIKTRMEVRTLSDGDEVHYNVESDENALLIGREGRTLLALQFMLRNFLNTYVDGHIIVSLDIGNYHENRRKQLEILATKTAKEVAQTKIAVKLDPMNAFDRRIIHTKLSEWRDVVTESEGDGEERALVIKPKR
ncbi:RNA-binding cell elongation regulator Jag/EloR [Peloplasma aerotolerans]|jgi:spoIIIJ-associated protein|uniref:RNA-binding protein KhpB n=1 Tax=Peloplasma aerotolerans TaxID=3044389 RepID=A0AAW6U6P7_9MOLU|nr:RNA-binding cell elongation regulator Jag/EloR [Mariniplasma sp. M4Ah]MDI6452202.1 RNA-binding cell elongation regulator Jag/EloR [Mariniplasma sp. M4Ah]MDR4968254.1 RNA-binding cell elongation regulator Jag/EloR [Acholeplasmataceae bacterium]